MAERQDSANSTVFTFHDYNRDGISDGIERKVTLPADITFFDYARIQNDKLLTTWGEPDGRGGQNCKSQLYSIRSGFLSSDIYRSDFVAVSDVVTIANTAVGMVPSTSIIGEKAVQLWGYAGGINAIEPASKLNVTTTDLAAMQGRVIVADGNNPVITNGYGRTTMASGAEPTIFKITPATDATVEFTGFRPGIDKIDLSAFASWEMDFSRLHITQAGSLQTVRVGGGGVSIQIPNAPALTAGDFIGLVPEPSLSANPTPSRDASASESPSASITAEASRAPSYSESPSKSPSTSPTAAVSPIASISPCGDEGVSGGDKRAGCGPLRSHSPSSTVTPSIESPFASLTPSPSAWAEISQAPQLDGPNTPHPHQDSNILESAAPGIATIGTLGLVTLLYAKSPAFKGFVNWVGSGIVTATSALSNWTLPQERVPDTAAIEMTSIAVQTRQLAGSRVAGNGNIAATSPQARAVTPRNGEIVGLATNRLAEERAAQTNTAAQRER